MRKQKTKAPLEFHKEIESFLEVLQRETDRGAILVAGGWLDDQLKVYLKAFFVDDEDVFKEVESRALIHSQSALT